MHPLRGRLHVLANAHPTEDRPPVIDGRLDDAVWAQAPTVSDFVSFTYIPGTVLHAGYGSIYNRERWDGAFYVPDDGWLEKNRGFFFKASYLWRL